MDLKNGYPYWLIKNGLPYDYPKLESDVKTSVVIIGGGISGALTAYFLINSGVECVLVDKRSIGLGSTCASTSLLQYELDIPLVQLTEMIGFRPASRAYELCGEAVEDLKFIMQKIKSDDYEKCGSLYFAVSKNDETLIQAEYDIRKKAGFSVEYLTSDQVDSIYGFNTPGAIYSQLGACVDSYKLTHQLLQYCIKKGLRVYDRTTISNTEYLESGVVLTTANSYSISTEKVVNATGYEVLNFINRPIVKLHSTYAVISEHSNPGSNNIWANRCMIWSTGNPYLYIRTTSDNRIVVGGRDEEFYDPSARDKLIKTKTKQLTSDFQRLFPNIPFIPEFSWTGTFGVTEDSLPYIGSLPEFPHTYFALGFGGNGITFSVIAAEIIKDKILGHENRDETLFAFDRKTIPGVSNNVPPHEEFT